MNPSIQLLSATRLVGMRIQMNFITNKTQQLWKRFMPRKFEIENSVGSELYSVENYPDLTFFDQFNPATEFEKWAAVKVEDFENIPEGMEKLIIPNGLYAVFPFEGAASDAPKIYQLIIGKWIPASNYVLDLRPHFALMGEKYKNNDPDSEEDFWIPIRPYSNDF